MADINMTVSEGVRLGLDVEAAGSGSSPVISVNGRTGAVTGLIDAPANPSTGAFLVWDGTAWTAQTLSTWEGGNY